jgi:hypothetical protein
MVSLTDSGHLGTAQKTYGRYAECHLEKLLIGFLEKLAWLRDGQNNFSALVIILFANNYKFAGQNNA